MKTNSSSMKTSILSAKNKIVSHIFSKALVLLTLIFMTNAALAGGPSFTQKDISQVGWSVVLVDTIYDAETDSTTFVYELTALIGEKDLSHWVLAVDVDSIPLADPSTNTSYGLDPTTGVYGLKWDDGQDSGTKALYSITLPGQYETGEIDYSVKGGTYYAIGSVEGPVSKIIVNEQTYSISGFVFLDSNANTIMDAEEPLLSNVSVALYDDLGNIVASMLSGADGSYTFSGLVSGNYQVVIAPVTTTEDFNEKLFAYFSTTASSIDIEISNSDIDEANFPFLINVSAIAADLNPADTDGDSFTFAGTGKTIGFWKHQNTVAIKNKGRAEIDAVTLLNYLSDIESLYLVDPFQFSLGKEYAEALAILSSTSSIAKDLLLKQLLATELNHIAGKGLSGYQDLQGIIINWAEFLAANSSSFTRDQLLAAKDILDYINNTGE